MATAASVSEMSHAPTSHVSHKFTWQSWPAVQLEGGYSVERLILMFRRQTSNLRRARLKASTTNAPFQVEGRGDETITRSVDCVNFRGRSSSSRKGKGKGTKYGVSYVCTFMEEGTIGHTAAAAHCTCSIAFAFACVDLHFAFCILLRRLFKCSNVGTLTVHILAAPPSMIPSTYCNGC